MKGQIQQEGQNGMDRNALRDSQIGLERMVKNSGQEIGKVKGGEERPGTDGQSHREAQAGQSATR